MTSTETPSGVILAINGHAVTPKSQVDGGELFKSDATKSNYILIQFTDYPTSQQEQQLQDLGVRYCRRIYENSWLARFEPVDLSPIRQLPFVLYANPYHETLSLHPDFKAELLEERRPGLVASSSTTPEVHEVSIRIHPKARTPEELREYIASNHGISKDSLFPEMQALRAFLTAEQILRISKIDDVATILKVPVYTLQNHLTGGVIKSIEAQGIAATQLDCDYGKFDLTGKGEIICFADSGFDQGRIEPNLMDWTLGRDPVHPFFTKRVLKLDARSEDVGRVGQSNDLSSHGTHVAGTALGRCEDMERQPAIKLNGPVLNGVAPEAHMVMQNICGSGGTVKLPAGRYVYERLFVDPYFSYPRDYYPKPRQGTMLQPKEDSETVKWQVRIHNNSWGTTPKKSFPVGYTPDGEDVDLTAYLLPDLCIVFGAGNDGDSAEVTTDFPELTGDFRRGQINGYATGKNVITVGACYNGQYIRTENKPSNGTDDNLYQRYWPPGTQDRQGGEAVSPCHVPRFSSRGPAIHNNDHTLGMRDAHRHIIKPDVVAPGVAIYSARSRDNKTDTASGGKAPKDNPLCVFKSGTSMATPVVSGAIALLRQALKLRHPNPSAALLKALIVNGAVDLRGPGMAGTLAPGNVTADPINGCGDTQAHDLEPAPSDAQGFGRLDISDSIENVVLLSQSGIVDAKPPRPATEPDGPLRYTPTEEPADVKRFRVEIAPPKNLAKFPTRAKAHLKATVAYTDLPGEGVQNQLALSIEFADPVIAATKNTSVNDAGDIRKTRMRKNNVQKLIVRDLGNTHFADAKTPIIAWVVVTAVNIAIDPTLDDRVVSGVNLRTPLSFAVVWKFWYTE